MYIVTIENYGEFTEIHNRTSKLLSGTVVQGINTIDTFTFTILPSNRGFDSIKDMKTLVTVYNLNKSRYEFYGRVLYTSTEMTEDGLISKTVTCESYFGYLCDSQQLYVAEQNWTVNGLLSHIIETHNSLLESKKRFKVGTITVTDPNDNLYCGIQRENTWETIKKKLIDVLGGEIQFRVVGDDIYIDYLKRVGEVKTTEIALSKNMKSITRERDPSEYVTRLIPLGAKISDDSEERITIEGVNGKIYVDDGRGINDYGIHVGYVEWDDVTDPQLLYAKANKWLLDNGKVLVKYSITALDLSLLGLDIDDFERGNTHPIKNALIGIDDTARIIKKNIDITDDTKGTIEVGDKFKTLTEIRQDQKRETVAAVKVIQRVNGDYVSKTDKDRVVEMVNDSTKKVTIDRNRLEVNSDKFGLSADGTLTARDVDISGRFQATGTRSPATDVNVDVSVTIEDGEIFTKGTSTEHTLSGAQQVGTGADYIYCDEGSLKYTLLPWILDFAYKMAGGDYTSVGGIRSTYGTNAGNPNVVVNSMEMYGNWHVSGNMTLASGEAVTSDEKKKNTIADLAEQEKYSALFDKLKPSLFKYNDGTSDRLHIGFIAQQVKEALDEAGIDPKDFAALCIEQNRGGTEDWSLRYSEFIAMNTLEIQKLKARVEELEKSLAPNKEI